MPAPTTAASARLERQRQSGREPSVAPTRKTVSSPANHKPHPLTTLIRSSHQPEHQSRSAEALCRTPAPWKNSAPQATFSVRHHRRRPPPPPRPPGAAIGRRGERREGFPCLGEREGEDGVAGLVRHHHFLVLPVEREVPELHERVVPDRVARRHVAVVVDAPHAEERRRIFSRLVVPGHARPIALRSDRQTAASAPGSCGSPESR